MRETSRNAKPRLEIKKVKDDPARRRIVKAIDGLTTNPRPPGAIAIQGGDRLLRVRAGDYRILYTVNDDGLTVLVVTIGHRRDVLRTHDKEGRVKWPMPTGFT